MMIPKVIQDYDENKNSDDTSNLDSGFDYHFDKDEMKAIAVFLRQHQNLIPNELLKFQEILEQKIYSSMTISEIKKFYSQGIK